MIIGIIVNIIFLNLFFAWFHYYKKYEQEAMARAKFRAELKEIIEEAFSNIEFNATWKECESDTLLDYYIQQDKIHIEDF